MKNPKPPKNPLLPSEATIQENIVFLLSRLAIPGNFIFFSIPNERIVSALPEVKRFAIINKLKRMGMLPGAADLEIVKEGRSYFLEVKAKGRKQTENQKIFQAEALSHGAKYKLAFSCDDVLAVLKEWGIVR